MWYNHHLTNIKNVSARYYLWEVDNVHQNNNNGLVCAEKKFVYKIRILKMFLDLSLVILVLENLCLPWW